MAKNDLIGGALWEQYSHKVGERMNNPRHRGEISEEEAKAMGARLVVADWGAEACGDAVRLYWAVDPKDDRILEAKFKSFGCGTAIASSDMMAELSIGKTVDEAMKITNIEVEKSLRDDADTPAIPPQKMHCSVMAYDVIKKAASIYKGVDMSSLAEEEIVCECARVGLRTIQDVIRINDLKTVEEITHYTKAGAFCKSCIRPGGHEKRKHYLVDILRDTRAAMEKEKLFAQADSGEFGAKNLIQKHRADREGPGREDPAGAGRRRRQPGGGRHPRGRGHDRRLHPLPGRLPGLHQQHQGHAAVHREPAAPGAGRHHPRHPAVAASMAL